MALDLNRYPESCHCLAPAVSNFWGSLQLAFLLESINERRQLVFHKAKKIYAVRSRIAHEGRPEKADDLIELMPYALAFAIHAIVKVSGLISGLGWQKFDELKQHFEDMKFSSGV